MRSPETAQPSISVVIPTYGRAELLPRVLDAWLERAPAQGRFQIVVVDDGSPDDTAALLAGRAAEAPGVIRVVRQPNRGLAAARNAGIEAAEGDLLLFSDDDMVPLSQDLLTRHVEAQARSPGAWVSHLQVPDGCARTPFQAFWRRRLHGGTDRLPAGTDLRASGFWFASLSLPRTLLGSLRFDETFQGYGWEEHELGFRLHRSGVRARFLRGAYLEHHDPVTLKTSYEKHVAMGRAAWTFSRLHPGARVAFWTGANAPSLWWRRVTRLEARAAHLLAAPNGALTDQRYALALEGGYSRGLREGRPRSE